MTKPFTLSPTAERLLEQLEAREAARRKTRQGEGAEESPASKTKSSPVIVGLGPNPLDLLDKAK